MPYIAAGVTSIGSHSVAVIELRDSGSHESSALCKLPISAFLDTFYLGLCSFCQVSISFNYFTLM